MAGCRGDPKRSTPCRLPSCRLRDCRLSTVDCRLPDALRRYFRLTFTEASTVRLMAPGGSPAGLAMPLPAADQLELDGWTILASSTSIWPLPLPSNEVSF